MTIHSSLCLVGSLGATKKDMHDIVGYTRSKIREDRPVHLLGIGGVRDIFHGALPCNNTCLATKKSVT